MRMLVWQEHVAAAHTNIQPQCQQGCQEAESSQEALGSTGEQRLKSRHKSVKWGRLIPPHNFLVMAAMNPRNATRSLQKGISTLKEKSRQAGTWGLENDNTVRLHRTQHQTQLPGPSCRRQHKKMWESLSLKKMGREKQRTPIRKEKGENERTENQWNWKQQRNWTEGSSFEKLNKNGKKILVKLAK